MKWYYELPFLIMLLVCGVLIGLSHNTIQTQEDCNNFIIENYYEQTYDECVSRCDAYAGIVINYGNKTITANTKYPLPFDTHKYEGD